MKPSIILLTSVTLLTIGWMVTPAQAGPGDVHDAAADWDKDNNPNGDWSYIFNDLVGAFYPSAAFPSAINGTLMPRHVIFGRPFWALTDNADCCLAEDGTFFGFPLAVGANGPMGIRWTVPAGTTPTVTLSASIRQIFEPGRQKRLEIQLNGLDIPHDDGDLNDDPTTTVLLATPPTINNDPSTSTLVTLAPEPVISVSPGDIIDFILDPYGPDGNGLTTLALYDLIITEEPATANADFDGDGDKDGVDFLIWQRGFGMGGQVDNSNGDADGSGTVDGIDLAIWETQYSTLSAVQAVPEPATGLLLALAAVVLLVQRANPIDAC